MNPHTRLIAENVISVSNGGNPHISAAHPTAALNDPMNPTYSMYRSVVVVELKVSLALAKKLNETAMTKPEKFPKA
jgi:hypothetical protein